MPVLQPVGLAVKAALTRLRSMLFDRAGGRWGHWWGPPRAFSMEVGDGRGGSIVEPTLKWIGKNFSEAPPRVRRPNRADDYDEIPDHELTRLLKRPNPAYSGLTLWLATLPDWKLGNAYWYKVRSAGGRVVQLWWLPSPSVEPRWPEDDPTVFVGWYDYTVNGQKVELDPRDVVHFRNGLDPRNTRKGKSDLACVLTEVFTDDEAARFSAAILKNLGVPGVIISADTAEAPIGPEEAGAIREGWGGKFGGDHRGEPLVLGAPVKVEIVSFSPQQLNLKDLRRVPEERITAALGVPALVAGMGVGLDHATLANAETLDRMAVRNELVPDWRFFAEEIQYQLLSEFEDPARGAVFDFDLRQVQSLQEDQTQVVTRIDTQWRSGLISWNSAQTALGREPIGPAGDVLALPINLTLVPEGELLTLARASEPEPPDDDELAALRNGRANGTGRNGTASLTRKNDGATFALDTKAVDAWVGSMNRLEERLRRSGAAEVRRFLNGQQARILSGLKAQKAAETEPEPVDWHEEELLLAMALLSLYRRALDGTTDLARVYLGTEIALPEPAVRQYLTSVPAGRPALMTDATRRAVTEAVAESRVAGETEAQLAARLRALPAFSDSRAALIARNELAAATLRATVVAAEVSGQVRELTIYDPDGSDGAFTGCVDRHGAVIPLTEGYGVGLLHVGCQVRLVPRAVVTASANGKVAVGGAAA